jgi:Zn-dependent M28 family amino/carboxypeptidase
LSIFEGEEGNSVTRHSGARRGLCLVALAAFCLVLSTSGKAAEKLPAFSGGRAFADLQHLVSFGPRPSGTSKLAEAREWMLGQLRQAGATVEEDRFTASTPIGPLQMSNVIAKFPGPGRNVVILAGHYDTARIPHVAFVGANDGGSSAALLLEMAGALRGHHYPFSVWLVFFDGEEATRQWSSTDSLYGSRHFVQKLSASGELGRVQAMILVDMIGDAKLQIPREENSTRWLNDLIFSEARKLGYGRYFPSQPQAIDDDHIPFVNAGVSAADLIDFNYGPGNSYWHTAQDTVAHCSAVSLTIVGRVLLATLDALGRSSRLK